MFIHKTFGSCHKPDLWFWVLHHFWQRLTSCTRVELFLHWLRTKNNLCLMLQQLTCHKTKEKHKAKPRLELYEAKSLSCSHICGWICAQDEGDTAYRLKQGWDQDNDKPRSTWGQEQDGRSDNAWHLGLWHSKKNNENKIQKTKKSRSVGIGKKDKSVRIYRGFKDQIDLIFNPFTPKL